MQGMKKRKSPKAETVNSHFSRAIACTLLPEGNPLRDPWALDRECERVASEIMRRLPSLLRGGELRISEQQSRTGPKGPRIDYQKLELAVEVLRLNRKLSIASACKNLAKRPEWKGHSAGSLERTYRRSRTERAALRQNLRT
jgi:hypothetical protein